MPCLGPDLVLQHNVVLFHGPPGSGKTTTALAVAQKLSIRLSQVYPAAKLLCINSHALLSQYFSESGKLVNKLFDSLWSISSDDNTLLIALIDEIESIAGSRDTANRRGEPIDSMRVSLRKLHRFTHAIDARYSIINPPQLSSRSFVIPELIV
jgi:SpoVK/Ycf46/Vps4 family AAA+-type ATPase